jgi:hypothetical protein
VYYSSFIKLFAWCTFFISTLSHADLEFLPSTPSIDSPANNSVQVSTLPRLSSSLPAATSLVDSSEVDVEIVESEWLFYSTNKDYHNLETSILGGISNSNSLENFSNQYQEINSPISISIDGLTVSKLRIYSIPRIDLLTESGALIRTIGITPDNIGKVKFQNPAAIWMHVSRGFNDIVLINWPLQSANTDTLWRETFQIYLDNNGLILRLKNPSLTNPIFSLADSQAGCGHPFDKYQSLPQWSTELRASGHDEFMIGCFHEGTAISNSISSSTAELSDIPEHIIRTTSSVDQTITNRIRAGQEYKAVVRYQLKESGSNSSNNTVSSYWSNPVQFSTDINAELQLEVPDDLNFIFRKPKVLNFKLKNNGPDIARPRIEFEYNEKSIFNGVSGRLIDYINMEIEGEFNTLLRTGSPISTSSSIDQLDDSIDVVLTATITERETSEIKYRLCNITECSGVEFQTLSISVYDNEDAIPTVDDTKDSQSVNGSSGGGSLTWLLSLFFTVISLKFRKEHFNA